jgi:hypothetical protein
MKHSVYTYVYVQEESYGKFCKGTDQSLSKYLN